MTQLKELRYLHLGSGASVQDIGPITVLKNLTALSIENFQKINDYSCLTALSNLESLAIEGDGFSPKYIHIDSLSFLNELPLLRFLRLLTIRLNDKDYTPILNLKNLEHLTLLGSKEVKKNTQNLSSFLI